MAVAIIPSHENKRTVPTPPSASFSSEMFCLSDGPPMIFNRVMHPAKNPVRLSALHAWPYASSISQGTLHICEQPRQIEVVQHLPGDLLIWRIVVEVRGGIDLHCASLLKPSTCLSTRALMTLVQGTRQLCRAKRKLCLPLPLCFRTGFSR